MQDDAFRRLMSIFREEAHEELDELRVLLERLGSESPGAHGDIFGAAMRVTHNLKGASASVGLNTMSELAHRLESGLLAARDGQGGKLEQILALSQRAVNAMQVLAEGGAVEVEDLMVALAGCVGAVDLPDDDDHEAWPSEELTAAETQAETAGPGRSPPEGAVRTEPREIGEAIQVSPARRQGIRVDVEKLEGLARHTRELLSSQAAFAGQSAAAEALYEAATSELIGLAPAEQQRWMPLLEGLERLVQQERDGLRRITRLGADLAEAIRRMRLVPVAALDSSWRRCVAEAAQTTGKEVTLAITSGGVELDKQVLDRLVEPMLHLLRNAVDHGIEPSDERVQRGKPRRGRVAVAACMSGDRVELVVEDDGAGIDLERLRTTAVTRGRTCEQLERMSLQDTLDLLFEPGFSTASRVSTVSGRGVGLDIVRRTVEELGGRIELSPSGQLGGARFALVVPVSILSTHALLVRAGRTIYALPVDGIVRTLRIAPQALALIDGDRVLTVEGQPVRVRSLALLLERSVRPRADGDAVAVILQRGGRWLAVEVDEVIGDQELAVQRLPWNLRCVRGVSGAIALPAGGVAIALDVGHLTRTSGATAGSARQWSLPSGSARRILVVDDSLTARTSARHALESAGYEVATAVDGLQGWEALRAGDFALLVSDVRMPHLDGIALTRRVRGDERLKSLPVVLITTEGNPEDVQRGLAAGADEYVIKGPLQQQKLLEAVTRHL